MKKQLLTTAAAVAAISAAPVMAGEPAPVPAPMPTSSAITADISLGYASDYAYRGIVADESMQDDVFTFGLGLNYDDGAGNQYFADLFYRNLDGAAGAAGFGGGIGIDDHVTVTVGARRELIPNLTGTLAYAYNSGGYYDFAGVNGFGPAETSDGHELQAKLDYAINPDFVVYGLAAYDFGEAIEGSYFELGGAYNYAVTDRVSLVFSAAVSASNSYYPSFPNSDNDGVGHWEARISAPVQVTEGLTITPYVTYVQSLDVIDEYSDPTNGIFGQMLQDDAVIGGVEAVMTF